MIKCKNECPSGKFEGCCKFCSEEGCMTRCDDTPETCKDVVTETDNLPTVFESEAELVILKITNIVTQKKKLEEAEKEMKEQLRLAMEKYEVKKFSNDVISITYVAPTTRTSIDSAKLKKELPDIATKYSKTSNVSGSIKISVNE